MRVLVAGGTGFVGRHVVAALQRAGHHAVVVARRPASVPRDTEFLRADLSAQDLPAEAMGSCDAVINLVGIKRGASQQFRDAHVQVVNRLLEAATAAGVARMVHISVAGLDSLGEGPYPATKLEAEALIHTSDRDWTILRPGPIYGAGDDVIRNVVRGLWIAPPFPLPGGGGGQLGLVDVNDVAEAAVRCLDRPDTVGKTIDLVGPERSVRQLVTEVGQALELSVWPVPVPTAVLRPAATVMERLLPDPLITTSQLTMLGRGLTGEPSTAQAELGISPGPLTPQRIRECVPNGPAMGLRLSPTPAHRRALRAHGDAMPRSLGFVALVLAAMLMLPSFLPHVWWRMLAVESVAAAIALMFLPLAWRDLLRPRASQILVGLVAAAVLYLGGLAVVQLILGPAGLTPQLVDLMQWRSLLPAPLALGMLVLIVVGEDLVWRVGVTLPLAARLGPWAGASLGAVAFAVAHLTSGPPVLALAALGAGFVWSVLAIRTNGLWAPLVCHLVWDLLVMFVAPYPTG